jgi:hypothetical protein
LKEEDIMAGTRALTVLIPRKAVVSVEEARALAVPMARRDGFDGDPKEEVIDDPDQSFAFHWETEW